MVNLFHKEMHGSKIVIDPWEKALPGRMRTLLLTSPIHRLESSKAHRMGELRNQDLRMLALRVLDATIERMGLVGITFQTSQWQRDGDDGVILLEQYGNNSIPTGGFSKRS